MPAQARQQKAQETRERLIRAAATVFGRRGYEGATFREIAQEAGLSRGLLSFHFRNKRDLELSVARRASRRWAQAFAELFHDRDEHTVARFLSIHESMVLGERELLRLLARLRLDPGDETAPLREQVEGIDVGLTQAAQIVVAELTGRPTEEVAVEMVGRVQWFLSTLHGLELRGAAGEDPDPLRAAYRSLHRDLVVLLGLDGGTDPLPPSAKVRPPGD